VDPVPDPLLLRKSGSAGNLSDKIHYKSKDFLFFIIGGVGLSP
jgi:hypothetical protein